MSNLTPSLRIGLLDNSYHSLKRGYELWNQWKDTDNAWLLKESIIWVHHGIELSLKQLLAQTNAFLVFENVDSAIENLGKLRKKEGMENAGVIDLFDNSDRVKSVGFQVLIERVAVALSIPELAKNAPLRQKIDELTSYRNKIVHFSIELNIAATSNLLSDILDPLLSMLEREVKDDSFIQNRIPEIREIAQPVKKFSEQLNRQMQEAVHRAVHATISALPPKGNRKAGIVWQSVGTGLGAIVVGYLMEVKRISKLRHNHIIVITNRVDLATQIYLQISAITSQDDTHKVVIPASAMAVVEVLNSEEPKIVVSTIQKFITNTFFFDKDCLLVAYNVYLSPESIKVSLPNATQILFTSSPPQQDTRLMLNYGEIVSKYDFKQAILDGFVMPFRIEKRIPDLNLDIPSLIKTEPDLDKPLSVPVNAVITHPKRIVLLSEDIVNHFRVRQKTFLVKVLLSFLIFNRVLLIHRL
jgi:hypothetical protein